MSPIVPHQSLPRAPRLFVAQLIKCVASLAELAKDFPDVNKRERDYPDYHDIQGNRAPLVATRYLQALKIKKKTMVHNGDYVTCI